MLSLIGLLGGGAWGAYLAKKRGGNRKDMAQYAAGFGIMWGLAGIIATVIIGSLA